MSRPKFSVIIPVYNQADFLRDAVQSILEQTCQDFEVIIVNDASPDHTNEVAASFTDPRVRCIVHEKNKGLPGARNTGIAASLGEYIALLDADDFFHPQKLELHRWFFEQHPEIGITYNPRFELHYSSNKIRDIYRPPLSVGLRDFVLGFPFSPSDMVLRRECIDQGYIFGDQYVCGGEDMDYPCRLALGGFRFASVDRVLNFRRYHSGRKKKKLRCRIGDYTKALESVILDPRCPEEVRDLRKQGFANHYTEVASWAFAQGEYELAREILSEIILCDPSAVQGMPSKLHNALFLYSIRDESLDHEQILKSVFKNLPTELICPPDIYNWLVARGYLLRGTRAVFWGDIESGKFHFQRAAELKADADRVYLNQLCAQLLSYQAEFGRHATKEILDRLKPYVEEIGGKPSVRYLDGHISVNQAFMNFRNKEYALVLEDIRQVARVDPKRLINRGILSIAMRSIFRQIR